MINANSNDVNIHNKQTNNIKCLKMADTRYGTTRIVACDKKEADTFIADIKKTQKKEDKTNVFTSFLGSLGGAIYGLKKYGSNSGKFLLPTTIMAMGGLIAGLVINTINPEGTKNKKHDFIDKHGDNVYSSETMKNTPCTTVGILTSSTTVGVKDENGNRKISNKVGSLNDLSEEKCIANEGEATEFLKDSKKFINNGKRIISFGLLGSLLGSCGYAIATKGKNMKLHKEIFVAMFGAGIGTGITAFFGKDIKHPFDILKSNQNNNNKA